MMTKDPTFKTLVKDPERSQRYQDYRKAWDERAETMDPGEFPIHMDVETVATCDLKCGSNQKNPEGFCQVWTHEHIRKLGFEDKHYNRPDHIPKGMMDPYKFYNLVSEARDAGVMSVKLNYRGEPSLHPDIDTFVLFCAKEGFEDIMMNTNGNGGARKDPEIFAKIVKAGITSLNFSVDSSCQSTYSKQRVRGDWSRLVNSVRSAVLARDMGFGSQDLRIRASAVRTSLNMGEIDSGRLEEFWVDEIGVDWVSVSECYFPAGFAHEWRAVDWEQVTARDFTCADPFRRMVVTWNLEHTLPCCQGFTKEWDGGELYKYTDRNQISNCWLSNSFEQMRRLHTNKVWDVAFAGKMCQECALTKKPVRVEV
jgi:hypothetical protein